MRPTASRRVLRASTLAVGISLAALASPAHAVPPDAWEDPDNGSMLEQLLILVGIPLLIIAVITLLTYLPSLTRKKSSQPSHAFQERSEWMGGPRKGIDAADGSTAEESSSSRGGASGSW